MTRKAFWMSETLHRHRSAVLRGCIEGSLALHAPSSNHLDLGGPTPALPAPFFEMPDNKLIKATGKRSLGCKIKCTAPASPTPGA